MAPSTRSASCGVRHHRDDVREPQRLPRPLERPAFEREAVAVPLADITGGAAKTQHRVGLVGFELPSADQLGVLVGFEVAEPHDRRLGIARGGQLGHAACQMLHEVLRSQPEPVVRHAAEAMALPWKQKEVESLVCLDERIRHADGIGRVHVVVDVAGSQEQVPFQVVRQFRVARDVIVE